MYIRFKQPCKLGRNYYPILENWATFFLLRLWLSGRISAQLYVDIGPIRKVLNAWQC